MHTVHSAKQKLRVVSKQDQCGNSETDSAEYSEKEMKKHSTTKIRSHSSIQKQRSEICLNTELQECSGVARFLAPGASNYKGCPLTEIINPKKISLIEFPYIQLSKLKFGGRRVSIFSFKIFILPPNLPLLRL